MSVPKVRIRCYVEEIDGDGVIDRNISFGHVVEITEIRDFFDRSGIAVDQLFRPTYNLSYAVKYVNDPNRPFVNKINGIKVVRELTMAGLKEAKDAVENATGTGYKSVDNIVVVCEGLKAAERAAHVLEQTGMTVAIEPANINVLTAAGILKVAKELK